jgi:hypothetical protein
MTNSITNTQSSLSAERLASPKGLAAALNHALAAALCDAAKPASVVVSEVLAAAGEPPSDPNSGAGRAYSAMLEATVEFARACEECGRETVAHLRDAELVQARAEDWKERYRAGKAAAKARGSSLGGTPSIYTEPVRAMTAQGMSIAAIAKALKISRSAVSRARERCRKAQDAERHNAAEQASVQRTAEAAGPSVPTGTSWSILDWIALCGG